MTNAARELLASYYENHHAIHRGGGFVFAGAERGELFREWVGTGKRVLDLGCRDGALTRFYAPGNEVVGVDIDRRALATARVDLGIDVLWHDLNEALPFEPESFDVVVTAELIEHLPRPSDLLAQVARVLRPTGASIGSVPNAFRLKNRLRFLFGEHFESDPTHLKQFSAAALSALLERWFEKPELRFLSSRFLAFGPRLFANDMAWRSCKPSG